MILCKLITAVMAVSKWFGIIKAGATILGGAIGAISAPVWIVIGAITALVALFVGLYKSNEEFRDLVIGVWETIKETISTIIQVVSDFVMEICGGLMEWWNENNELIMEALEAVWQRIQDIIMTALNIIVPIVKAAWESIKIIVESVWNVIKAIIETAINLIKGIIKAVMQMITGDWRGAWEKIKSTVYNFLFGIMNIIYNIKIAWFIFIKSSVIYNKLHIII